MIRVSNNELRALLKRAFDGADWTFGCHEYAASAIWWLEAHGISWLEQLPHRWGRLDGAKTSKPELVKAPSTDSVIDARGSSLLHCSSSSVDLAYANASGGGLATVETRRCLDRILILPGLATLAARGTHALARWYSEEHLHFACIKANDSYPVYTRYQIPSFGSASLMSLFLACSQEDDGLDHYYRNKAQLDTAYDVDRLYSQDQFGSSARASRATGIEISESAYAILKEAANRLLVDTSEQSRRGAG